MLGAVVAGVAVPNMVVDALPNCGALLVVGGPNRGAELAATPNCGTVVAGGPNCGVAAVVLDVPNAGTALLPLIAPKTALVTGVMVALLLLLMLLAPNTNRGLLAAGAADVPIENVAALGSPNVGCTAVVIAAVTPNELFAVVAAGDVVGVKLKDLLVSNNGSVAWLPATWLLKADLAFALV